MRRISSKKWVWLAIRWLILSALIFHCDYFFLRQDLSVCKREEEEECSSGRCLLLLPLIKQQSSAARLCLPPLITHFPSPISCFLSHSSLLLAVPIFDLLTSFPSSLTPVPVFKFLYSLWSGNPFLSLPALAFKEWYSLRFKIGCKKFPVHALGCNCTFQAFQWHYSERPGEIKNTDPLLKDNVLSPWAATACNWLRKVSRSVALGKENSKLFFVHFSTSGFHQ